MPFECNELWIKFKIIIIALKPVLFGRFYDRGTGADPCSCI